MAKHIHIWLGATPTRDAGTAHDPSNGQEVEKNIATMKATPLSQSRQAKT